MGEQVIVEGIVFQSLIGVTDQERVAPQPLRVDIELDYEPEAFIPAADTDDIKEAIDYAKAVKCIIEIGTSGEFRLLERLAEQCVQALLTRFATAGVKLWIRKANPPLQDVQGAVGVCVSRTKAELEVDPQPADFLRQALQFLEKDKGTVLDVAAGRGRNTLYLARRGFTVEAIDRDEEALIELTALAKQRHLGQISVHTIDLEKTSTDRLPLADEHYQDRYDAVTVFFYLHRPLFPALIKALKPGGLLIYETFLIDNHRHYGHPRRNVFCLEHNELLRLTEGLRVLHYEEGRHGGGQGHDQAFTARLVAQKGLRGET